jgi:hypothetical protein
MLTFLIWCGLFLSCWPMAVLAVVALPLIWVMPLPFRLAGIVFGSAFGFLKAVVYLSAGVLGNVFAREQNP